MLDLTPMTIMHTFSMRRRARVWSVGIALYSLALALFLGAAFLASPRSEDYGAKLDRASAEVENQQSDVAELNAQIAQLHRRQDAAHAVGEHPDWSVALGLVSGARGDLSVVIERLQLMPVYPALEVTKARKPRGPLAPQDPPLPIRYELTLVGLAKSELDASKYALALEAIASFDKVVLVGTRSKVVLDKTYTSFDIRIEMTEATRSASMELP